MNLIPSGNGESSLFLCVSVKALAFMVPRRGLARLSVAIAPPARSATFTSSALRQRSGWLQVRKQESKKLRKGAF